MYGHVGMLFKDSEFVTLLSGDDSLIIPSNHGAYSTTVDTMDAINQAHHVAEHKIKVKKLELTFDSPRPYIIIL